MLLSSKRFMKMFLSIGFIFLSLSIYWVNNIGANGYEVSIYDSLPKILWIFLFGSILCGVSVTIYSIYLRKKIRTFTFLGIFLVVFSNCILLSLPLFKGYAVYGRWDALSHLGYVVDIIKYGYISDGDVYPIAHVCIAFFKYVSGISLTTIFLCLPALFLICYVLFTYILAKLLISHPKTQLLSALIATILLTSYGNYQVLPTVMSTFFLPLFLYFYFKRLMSKKLEIRVLLILLIILYPFFHPLTSLLVIMFILTMDLFMIFYNKSIVKDMELNFNIVNTTLFPSLLSLIIFISWISNSSNYNIWATNIRSLYFYIRGESYVLKMSGSITNTLDKINFQISDIIELYIKMYGHISIFLILAGIASIVIFKNSIVFSNKSLKYMFIYQSLFPLMCIITLINLFKTILFIGIWRLISVLCIITPICVSYIISEFILDRINIKTNDFKQKAGVIFTILLIMISSIGATFSLYPSPWIYQMNQQVSHMEINGMEWYYSHKNIEILDLNIRESFRFADFIFGVHGRKSRADIQVAERADTNPKYELPKNLITAHFNYLNYSMYGHSLIADYYIPLHRYDEIFYTEIYPQLAIFNASDFEQFGRDPTIDKIYNSGDLQINYVHSRKYENE